jgi:L-seryl-tRNA(Ser) seleniumtransferase
MELRDLPSIDGLAASLAEDFDLPDVVVVSIVKSQVEAARDALIAAGDADDPEVAARQRLSDIEAAKPRAVINATGVLLHTNLGRAQTPTKVSAISAEISQSASNVEIDIRTGRRSKRHDYLGAILPAVTGAKAGFAVNNNAGALLLALASVAGSGGRIAVSRGELIEIGGSFRLPDLMKASGAELVEVGTTNRTRASDYSQVADSVDGILKVHPSNYRIDGFKEEASYAELADIAHKAGIPLIADIGSGLMDETAPWLGDLDRSWLRTEPGVIQTVACGADLVLFSGDKLLGGPQAGIIVGASEAVRNAMSHPIARAVRLDGSAIAALAETMELYADQRVLEIPFWQMASASVDDIERRSLAIITSAGTSATVAPGESIPGAGSVPGEAIPTMLIRLEGSADQLWASLADAPTPIIATRRDGAVFLDLRSVRPEDDATVGKAIIDALT